MIVTVASAEWRALKDHKLMTAAQGNFHVFMTIDRGFEFEHNLRKLSFGIVIMHVPKNRIHYYRALFPALVAAVEKVRPGEVIHVRKTSHE